LNRASIVVSRLRNESWKKTLSSEENGGLDIIDSESVTFSDGHVADIRLIDGGPPYVDPVLFDENGHEVSVGEPDKTELAGTYIFSVGEDEYEAVVVVERASC